MPKGEIVVFSYAQRGKAALARTANSPPVQAQTAASAEPVPRVAQLQEQLAQLNKAPQGRSSTPVVQAMFIMDGKPRSLGKHFKEVAQLLDGQLERGDKKILKAMVRAPENVFGDDEDVSQAQVLAKIAELRAPKKAGTKRKSGDKPANYHERQPGGIGNQVDWETDRAFRIERRIRRRFPLGGRNLYMTRYEAKDEAGDKKDDKEPPLAKKVKMVTSSQPPGSLPQGHEGMEINMLASLTKIGHSEEQTKDVEDNFPLLKGYQRIGEATTREQCKDCRHKFPSTNLAHHHYGFKYSAPEDHIPDAPLRQKIKDNGGKKGDMKLSAEQSTMFQQATDSATWARQFAPDQNPALNRAYAKIEAQEDDSVAAFSDDEEPVYLNPFLFNGVKDKLKDGKIGKAPVFGIEPKFTFSKAQFDEQKAWIEEQGKKDKKGKDATGD